ncbi:akirin [Adelges cooleyi]|uniref:akirin n=1 Tax=Adelges cooleyi TaxID=133065 RepID=UPI00218067B7|nr:akirin [Adelges cooleyi]
MACATLKRSLDFEPPMCRPTKRQRCTPMSISPSSSPPNSSRSEYVSPHFGGDIVPKITAEMLSASLTEEVQRMRRKRQLNMEISENRNLDDSSSSDSSSENTFPSSAKDKPLFTFRQVGIICERMLNERESQLREEYDKILNMKLSEQYEAFVKFSNDQLHRRFEAAEDPSYLS